MNAFSERQLRSQQTNGDGATNTTPSCLNAALRHADPESRSMKARTIASVQQNATCAGEAMEHRHEHNERTTP
jgi:hypothetical protein